MGVSESKSAFASAISPASVIFKRSVTAGVPSASTESESAKRSSAVASAFQCQSRRLACPVTATSPGRSSTPKSVIKSALLKARRAARAELFQSIASRLAALKVPTISKLRPVALRQRPRLLS